jgi:hypothetical protein
MSGEEGFILIERYSRQESFIYAAMIRLMFKHLAQPSDSGIVNLLAKLISTRNILNMTSQTPSVLNLFQIAA